MQVINLRTLTDKSAMGFGMFADLTVRNIMDCNPSYLVWVYFHIGNISFCKQVIKELALEIHIIDKPGTDIDFYKKNSHLWGITIPKKKHGIANWELRSKRSLQMDNSWQKGRDGVVEGGTQLGN